MDWSHSRDTSILWNMDMVVDCPRLTNGDVSDTRKRALVRQKELDDVRFVLQGASYVLDFVSRPQKTSKGVRVSYSVRHSEPHWKMVHRAVVSIGPDHSRYMGSC